VVGGGDAVDNADEVEVGVQPMFSVEGVLEVGPMVGQGGNSRVQGNCIFVEHPHMVWRYIVLGAFRIVE